MEYRRVDSMKLLTEHKMARSIINLDKITPNNLGVLKKLDTVCSGVEHPKSWYEDVFKSDVISTMAFYAELPVGGLKCRPVNKLAQSESNDTKSNGGKAPSSIYIDMFVVLPAYRHLGVGTKMLEFLIEETKKRFVHKITVHIPTNNEEIVTWYIKHGFVKGDTIEKFYEEGDFADAVELSLSF